MEEPNGESRIDPPPIRASEAASNTRINFVLLFAVPLLSAAASMLIAMVAGFNSPVWSEVVMAVLIAGAVAGVPTAIGYGIAMIWRRLNPGYYFLIGMGMSVAAACVLLGVAFGACLLIFWSR